MVSVKTNVLKRQADNLKKNVQRYDDRCSVIEECMNWLKVQEFDGKEEIRRVLFRQHGDLIRQKKELLMLSEALWRICEKYEKTEQMIADYHEKLQGTEGYVNMVDLTHICDYLSKWGFRTADE